MSQSINAVLQWTRMFWYPSHASRYSHHRKVVNELRPFLKKLDAKTVLEVGSGEPPSMILDLLKELGIKSIGMDCNSEADIAADMHYLPFRENSFDLIVMRHVMEHSIYPWLALWEAKRVTRQHLLIIVPALIPEFLYWPDHFSMFPKIVWIHMFNKLGFKWEQLSDGDFTQEGMRPRTHTEWRFLLRKT